MTAELQRQIRGRDRGGAEDIMKDLAARQLAL